MIKYKNRKPSLFVHIEVEINGLHIVAKLKIHNIILHRKNIKIVIIHWFAILHMKNIIY